jgi:hypothetical protein
MTALPRRLPSAEAAGRAGRQKRQTEAKETNDAFS